MDPKALPPSHDTSQLFDFTDNLEALICLVYQSDTQTYQPYTRVKQKMYVLLRRERQWWEVIELEALQAGVGLEQVHTARCSEHFFKFIFIF